MLHPTAPESTSHLAYRPDIDGLRAISVLVVVFYHARIPGFSGGFVGVDVFFVISGFLITKIIVLDIHAKRFTFQNFYERRIRRILPALFAVYIACLIVGLILLLPSELKDFGKSLARSAYFVSNVYFYETSGYFKAPSHTKPLLHTWSLSVEEQFYIIWPIILILLFKYANRYAIHALIFSAIIASLMYAEWKIANQNQSASFYLMQARAWELLLGASLVFVPMRLRASALVWEVLALIGLGLIIGSAMLLTSGHSFPGLNAFFPCLGAVLVILSGQNASTAVSRILSLRYIVFIGVLSYSLYLWHWPIIVFSHVLMDRPPNLIEAVPLIFLSIGISFVSWYFIEQRFRHRRRAAKRARSQGRMVMAAGTVAIGVFIMVGVGTDSADGFPTRFGEEMRSVLSAAAARVRRRNCDELPGSTSESAGCDLGSPRSGDKYDVVLIGDSHAQHYADGLSAILQELDMSGRLIAKGGCLPLPRISVWENGEIRKKCDKIVKNVEEFLLNRDQGQLIIVAGRWAVYTEKNRSEIYGGLGLRLLSDDSKKDFTHYGSRRVFREKLSILVDNLVGRGKKILLLGQVPPYPSNPTPCVVKAIHRDASVGGCMVERKDTLEILKFSNSVLSRIAHQYPNVWHFNPMDVMCDRYKCNLFINKVYVYRDDDHINALGSEALWQYIKGLPVFRRFGRQNAE